MARKKKDKAPPDQAVQETQESPALDTDAGGEIHFERQDVEPEAAEPEPVPEPEPLPEPEPEPAPVPEPEPAPDPEPVAAAAPESSWDDPSWAGQSPADADWAAAQHAPSGGSAIGQVAGAFVGSFVLAKIIGRFGGDDD
jgi:hypothetical protein